MLYAVRLLHTAAMSALNTYRAEHKFVIQKYFILVLKECIVL